jgi:signal transduction histidine kinase
LKWLADARWRKTLILSGIILLAITRWFAPPAKAVHNVLYNLDVIPILVAGMFFGWRSAAWATAFTALLEFPQLWVVWGHDLVYATDQVVELAIFCAAGLVVGWLADRERKGRLELESVYSELRENLERLKKAERLSAVAQLSANMAHEIRNPLAGISGAAGILKRGNATADNAAECVEIIQKESQRLNKLLTSFLDFARPRTPRFQPTDLSEVIDSVVALAAHSPGADAIEFRRTIDGDLPEIECDSEQMKQVLLNLAINAIQATGTGVVEFQALTRGKWAVITVRDQGSGIPPEHQEHIFDPFFTTKDSGTGLGLAIASKIVEQHGGTLAAKSAPERGLDIVVQLPLQRVLAR